MNGLFSGPNDGVLLFLAQSYCCLLGKDKRRHRESQLGGKQASSDDSLGIAVLVCHGMCQECLLVEGEKAWRAAFDACDSVP